MKNRKTSENKQEKKENKGEADSLVRLNKFIADAGVCSRREADKLISSGQISINGKVVVEMGFKVGTTDKVVYNGKTLSSESLVYILLNKPKDFITTLDDPEGRKTVMQLVQNATKERIYSVGRLDRNTTGLLLFTNDGELAMKLSHPSYRMNKLYSVTLDKPIEKAHFDEISRGFSLEDGPVEVDDIAIVSKDRKSIGIEIHVGRNRIVRRIFEHFDYQVKQLDRVMYGQLTKKDLPRGKWRALKPGEVTLLKNFNSKQQRTGPDSKKH